MQKSYSHLKKQSRSGIWLPAARSAAAGVFLLSLVCHPSYAGNSGKESDSTLAVQELERRVQAVEGATTLVGEGDRLAAAGNHCEAADKFLQAAGMLRPGARATLELRNEAVRKHAFSAVECARGLAADGSFDQADARLNQVLAEDMSPRHKPALKLKERLKDPDWHNPAMTPAHGAKVRKVKRLLLMAEQLTELGSFDAARDAYNQVLAEDPTNTAARRGLENVEKHIEDYLKSTRDHTRLKMLNDVDRLLEVKVPYLAGVRAGENGAGELLTGSASASVGSKLRTIVIPRLAMTEATITEAIAYLSKKSIELDTSAEDESRRGVNIIWSPGTAGEGGTRPVTLDMRNVSLADAIQAVCDMSGTRFTTDGSVVRISTGAAGVMETRRFKVPPGFLSSAASATASDAGSDPFGSGDDAAARPKLGRLDPKTFLEQQGIPFPDGARAAYNAAENLLTVTNTAANIESIALFVEGLTTTGQRQALIQVILLKTSEERLEELGGEFFLDAFNASNGVFASGGTVGNSDLTSGTGSSNFGNAGFLPIEVPFNITQGAVTAGLRSSHELTKMQTIDDLINLSGGSGSSGTQNSSPYLAGIGGVFTDPRFQALVRGLNQKKGVELSVANSVVVKSGQRATSFSGRRFFYPTEFDPPQIPQTVVAPEPIFFDPTTGQLFTVPTDLNQPPITPATPNSFEEKEIGSSIEVEPTIGEDGHTVSLNLAVTFNEFDGFINYGTPIRAMDSPVILTDNRILQPVFSRATATTEVSIYDGRTVAIGGLSQSKTDTVEDKVPIWSSIPVVGRFFKTKLSRSTRMAVVYFVTVKIVDPAGETVHGSTTADTGGTAPEPLPSDNLFDAGPPPVIQGK